MAEVAPGQDAPLTFRDRYAQDADFKAQIDNSRLKREATQVTQQVTSALATASGRHGAKPKMY